MSEQSFKTSKEAYDWAIENGLISKRLSEVLHVLSTQGPMNQSVTYHRVMAYTGNTALEKPSISPRFATLCRMGLVEEAGKHPCPITGRTTITYRATNNRPVMTEAEANSSAEKRETNASLRARVAELEKELSVYRELDQMRTARIRQRQEAGPSCVEQQLAFA